MPDGEADCDGRVEVAPGCRSAGDDGECDSDCKSPADLKEGAECGYADGAFGIEGEGGNGCDAGEAIDGERSVGATVRTFSLEDSHVVEDAGGFSHAFSQPSWSGFTQQMPSLFSLW